MSFSPLRIIRGDARTLRYQLREDGSSRDITGMSFRFGVKERHTDAAYRIGPVEGTVDDAPEGKFSFALDSTHTDLDPFRGVYAVAMYDGGGNRTTLTPAGGVEFRVIEDIID